jgi:diguanylate cyclase (GGDEF)-like protein
MLKSLDADKLQRHWFAIGGLCLLPLLLLYLFVSGGPVQPNASKIPIALEIAPDSLERGAALSRDGQALLLKGDGIRSEVDLSFTLPRRESESPHWVVWMRRVPLDSIRLSAGEQWHSSERSFLLPSAEDGILPVGYVFRLPSAWEGDIRLRLEASSLRMSSLRPEVVPESVAAEYMQRATMITMTAYASLFTLGLLALALYFASRDMTFLSFFGFCTVCILQIAAYNGHLYRLDSLGVFAKLGSGGFSAISLIFQVAAMRILLRYTDLPRARPDWARRINIGNVALLLLACVLIAWGARTGGSVPWLLPFVWIAGGIAALVVLVDAWRRRVTMTTAVLCSVLGIVAAIAMSELTAAGIVAGTLLSHYGYQIAIVFSALMLSVGLISRISKYREQRDREQRAREESERKLYREAVRSELLTALQVGLRGLDEDEIQPSAYRLLLEHLHRIVPTSLALAMTRGHLGRDTLVSWPAAALDRMSEHDLQRLQTLRQQLSGTVELQYPVTKAGEDVPVAMEAAVSMPIRAPAWGALVLERSGATAFHPEELVIARELARIVVVQIDEAFTSFKLRHTAEVDALTGSMNRRSIDQALTRTFLQAHRVGQPLSVLFVDIDHFKTFNDMLGHACGDFCLRELALLLRSTLGTEDFLGRYGGEEFVVILPGRPTEMARAVAEELRVAVEAAEFKWNDRTLRLTVSIGVANRLDGETLPQPALERADRALYAAKRAGRNRVQVAPAVFKPRSTTAGT